MEALSTPEAGQTSRVTPELDLLRLVVIGSVDDGKSTLIGRLLYELGAVYDDQVAHVRRASKNGELDFSYFTDGLKAEREQGITIDVAYRSATSAKRRFIIADTPGHAEYTRNMATGASTADLALILVDARLGVLPQTRRHAYLASLLGVQSLAVAINKMDLVDYDEQVFRSVQQALGAFVDKLGFEQVTALPVSATRGDNVVRPARDRMPWYTGPSLLEFLDSTQVNRPRPEAPFRLPVQTVLRAEGDYRAFAGQVAAGTVRALDRVVVLPSGQAAQVAGIDSWGEARPSATAPLSVALRLTEHLDVGRGDVIAHATDAPSVTSRFSATIVWLDETPFDAARRYLLKHTTRTVPASLSLKGGTLVLETLETTPSSKLELNDVGLVAVVTRRPIVADRYADNRTTGAFILIDPLSNATVAAGVITHIDPAPKQTASGAEGGRGLLVGGRRRVARPTPGRGPRRPRRVALVATGRPEALEACRGAGLVTVVVEPGPHPSSTRPSPPPSTSSASGRSCEVRHEGLVASVTAALASAPPRFWSRPAPRRPPPARSVRLAAAGVGHHGLAARAFAPPPRGRGSVFVA